MIKIDSSNGGRGTFECENLADLKNINPQVFDSAVLIQKKIIGQELDLSGFYHDGKLIFFTYSEIKKVSENKFGPSVVRLYHQLGAIDKKIFLEMEQLGQALGADGFVTISCMESSEDKKRYFIEADMRPNSWVQFGKFFGDDPAKRISKWFLHQETPQYPSAINKKYPTQLLMPYFYRMLPTEILLNRYNVWKFLPIEDYKLVFHLLYTKSAIFLKMIKYIPTKLCRMIVRNKEHRIKIRTKFKEILQFFINKLYFFKKAV